MDPIVHWWFGPTGVGKSRKAFETYGSEAYVKMNDKWWDGYVGQKTVIFDDYRSNLCPFHILLRILDRYPYRVEVKGGSIELSATVFVITTTSLPEVIWYSRTGEAINQLLRRITHISAMNMEETIVLKDEDTTYVPLSKEEILLLHPEFAPQPNPGNLVF